MSRLANSVDDEMLKNFITSKFGVADVSCESIKPKYDGAYYKSFCVTCLVTDWDKMKDAEKWPDGAIVRQWHKARRPTPIDDAN